jgi:hypothetical protein
MAIKPSSLKSKDVVGYINSVPTRRVQTLDFVSNFTTDPVYEMGNPGIVEEAVTSVETGLTLNTFEWGTSDLEAMIYGIYEQRNIRGNVNGSGTITNTIGTIHVSSFGAGGHWTAATVNKWLQVIRWNASATVNDAEYVKISAKSYSASLKCDVLALDSSNQLTAPPATGDIVTVINDYTITEDTIDADPAHFILPHRYSSASTLMLHSIILPRCSVDGLTYNIDVGGAAEQNYTLVGEESRMLLGSRREAQSVFGSYMSYSDATVQFRIPLDCKGITGSPYIVYAGANIATLKRIAHSAGAVTIQARVGSGLGVDSATQLVYYYTNKTKLGHRKVTNIDSGIGKITKDYVEIEMQYGTGTTEVLSRCSGFSLNFPQARETIEELGSSRAVAKTLESNIRNEITLSFHRNDLREFAKLLGSQEAFDAGTLTEILTTSLKSSTDTNIYIKFYNHQETHDSNTLLKTITFEDCNFIGDNNTTPISGASGLELNFSSQTFNIVGSGLPPVYS